MAEPDFKNEKELEAWLEDRPVEWAQVIAHRAAMRVLPMIADQWRIDPRIERKQGLTLALFRANFISRVASANPTRNLRAFAASASDAASYAASASDAASSVDAAYAASYAATFPASPASSSAGSSSAAASYAATGTASVARSAASAIWRSVSQDAQWLLAREEAPPAAQASALLRVPLWREKMPDWIRQRFEELFRAVRADSENWNHWISWYSAAAAFDGGPTNDYFSQALELKIAEQPDEWWKRGAGAVNADIAKWVDEEAFSSARSDPEMEPEKATVDIEFTSENELKAWLEDKPVEWARVIAHRAAMRVLPLLADEWLTDAPIERKQGLTLAVFRANFISRVASTYPTRDMRAALSAADSAAYSADSAAYSAYSAADSAALSAYSAALSADSAAAAADSAAAAYSAAAAADSAADSAVWRSVSQDAQWLLAREQAPLAEQAKALLGVPLWREPIPATLYNRLLDIGHGPEATGKHRGETIWENWKAWYLAAAETGGARGSPFSEALELRIAEQPDKWWDRGAEAVNADIAEWVEEERGSISDAQVEQQTAQTAGALIFDATDDQPIHHRRRGAVDEWDTGPGAQRRHSEAHRLLNALIERCNVNRSPNNGVGMVSEAVELLLAALGADIGYLDPDYLIPRGDRLRKLLELYRLDKDSMDLPPVPDLVLLDLEGCVGAHNQLVLLDPALAKRDEALLGPDAKKRLVPPEEGQAKVEQALEAGVVEPEAKQALDEEAGVAPAIPDPEDRRSRRYSESHKNLLRKVVEVSWRVAKFGAPSSVAAWGIAAWALRNKDWFLQVFADNPAMVKLLNTLFDWLSTLPLL